MNYPIVVMAAFVGDVPRAALVCNCHHALAASAVMFVEAGYTELTIGPVTLDDDHPLRVEGRRLAEQVAEQEARRRANGTN